ncbi:MAG: agmatinase [Clostridia bacterium]|nr:agmatinase [Clostridia bacterium]
MRIKEQRHAFIGCESGYKDSKTVLFGAPFDGTSSYRAGSRFAPSAVRNESAGIETYSPYLDKDLVDSKVFDGGDLELPFGNAAKALKIIENYTAQILKDGKKPLMIGGEHLITLGAFRAVYKAYPNLCVIHFDAHTDLREDYAGEKLSHATVIKRIWEFTGDGRIFQFGIRSGERSEFEWAKKHTFLTKFNFCGLEEAVAEIGERPVYLTIDLDVLDPSEMSGTGTPEAGGVRFTELLQAVNLAAKCNIVACDINELSPPYDTSGASTALACKFIREVLLQL